LGTGKLSLLESAGASYLGLFHPSIRKISPHLGV
jgi:hypothetical protein